MHKHFRKIILMAGFMFSTFHAPSNATELDLYHEIELTTFWHQTITFHPVLGSRIKGAGVFPHLDHDNDKGEYTFNRNKVIDLTQGWDEAKKSFQSLGGIASVRLIKLEKTPDIRAQCAAYKASKKIIAATGDAPRVLALYKRLYNTLKKYEAKGSPYAKLHTPTVASYIAQLSCS